jgi:hypothetical protein
MIEPLVHKLSTPELQAALRIAQLPPAPASPFAALSPPASIEIPVMESLRARRVLSAQNGVSAEWRDALAALSSPSHRAALYLGSAVSGQIIDYYAAGQVLVGYSADAAEHRITFPYTAGTILKLLSDWMHWNEVPASPRTQLSLPTAELAALAAVVDAVREERLRAVLGRKPADTRSFSRDQLVYELDAGASADPRWLAGLLTRHALPAHRPDRALLNDGAQALGARGWLRFEGDRVLLEPPLADLGDRLATLSSHLRIGIGPVNGPGATVLMVQSGGSFWSFEFLSSDDGRPWTLIQSMGGPDAAAMCQRLLDLLPKPAPAASWTAAVPMPAQQPAAAPQPAALPIPVQQAPLRRTPAPQAAAPAVPVPPVAAAERKCPRCRKPLLPGRKFCTACGATV